MQEIKFTNNQKEYSKLFSDITEFVIKNSKKCDKQDITNFLDHIKENLLYYSKSYGIYHQNIVEYNDHIEITLITSSYILLDFYFDKKGKNTKYYKFHVSKYDEVRETYENSKHVLVLTKLGSNECFYIYFDDYKNMIEFSHTITSIN